MVDFWFENVVFEEDMFDDVLDKGLIRWDFCVEIIVLVFLYCKLLEMDVGSLGIIVDSEFFLECLFWLSLFFCFLRIFLLFLFML